MPKNITSTFVLSLVTLFVFPGELFAGHFGIFKRCQSRPVCCPVSDGCQPSPTCSVVAEAKTMLEIPVAGQIYHCQAFCEGYDENGETCMMPGKMCSGSDCEAVYAEAEASAAKACEDHGCEQSFIDVYCDIPCPDRLAMRTQVAGGCLWKATYTVRCCNGLVIKQAATSARLDFAKFKAKTFACSLAAIKCSEGIRCVQWQICRVPASSQTQCCK